MQLLGDLPADGEHWNDVGTIEADGAEIVGGYLFDLIASCLDRCYLNDERHEGLSAKRYLHPGPANVWAQFQRLGLVALEGKVFVVIREGGIEMREQGLGITAQDEIHISSYARLFAGSQLHRHAASGDKHDRSVIVYCASQCAGQHH
jgi:hypothetical protein